MNNRKVLKYHSYAGLIAGFVLVLMGLSGAILVFQHDIDNYRWQEYIEVDNFSGLHIDRGISTIQKNYPGWDTRLIHFEEEEALIFNLRNSNERLFVFVHPSSGEVIKELNELTTFTRWLLKFHYSLQAGPVGRTIVFVVGILFLFSLISGIYLYRKSIFKTLFFKTPVLTKNKRTFYSSLHRIVGTWALLLNFILVITGILLSWSVVVAGFKTSAAPNSPAVTVQVGSLLKEMQQELPDFQPTYIRLPLRPDASLVIYGFFDDDPFFYSEFFNYVSADYLSGEIKGVTKIQEANLGTKILSTVLPLHFGQYGGIWIKLLYCVIGLSGPFLSITGFLIWRQGKRVKRRRRKKIFYYL